VMNKFPVRRTFAIAGVALSLAACSSLSSPPPFPQSPSSSSPQQQGPGTAQPPPPAAPQPPPTAPSRPAPKQYRLGAASSALVAQAHKQVTGGDFGLAAATIERALRIEPDNPLLWIELGRVRYTAGDYGPADGMGRKALAFAAGDPQAQASAWRLIADSLRGRRRNDEAAEADKRANALAPQ